MEEMEEIEIAEVYFVNIKNGILNIIVKEDMHVELKHVKEVVLWRKNLQDKNPLLALLDVRNAGSIEKEVREYVSGKEVEGLDKAMAIITDSLPMNILTNFFIKFDKPPAPTKMFQSETKALAWLETFR